MTEPAMQDPGFEDSDPWQAATAADAAESAEPEATSEPAVAAGSAAAAEPGVTDETGVAGEAVEAVESGPAAPAPVAEVDRAVPETLPEAWAGREAIHDPPHAGYREVALPAPRPVRPAPPSPRRQAPPPGTDLLNNFQRWLIRSSARSARRQIEDSVRRTIKSARAEPEDPWGVATTEPPPDLTESPECAWCPICRAARRMRESGPGLSSVSDTVAAAVQDAFGALDGVLSRTTAATGHGRPTEPGSRSADSAGDHDHAERASDEPGDRG